MVSGIAIAFFPILMAFAASSDLLALRISNRLVLVLAAGFFLAAALVGMPLAEIGMHVLAGLLVLAVTFGFFAIGWIGGGDAKLAAATALWLGFGLALPYLLYASVAGGVLTVLLLVLRRWKLPESLARQGWIARLHAAKTGVPYGVALAIGGMLVYSQTTIFAALAA